MGEGFQRHLSAGLKGGLDSIKNGFSRLKSFVVGLGLFAGLPGLKDMAQHAIQMEGSYRHLAFAIKAGTGVGVEWRDLQKDIQRTALDTGNKTEDLAASFEGLFKDIGDPKFAASAMKSVAVAATASGESVQTLTEIAGTLNEKFGVTASQMDEALRGVLSLGNKGGVTVQQMSEKLGMVGSSAKAAGLDGVAGFSKIAALLNIADASTGSFKKGISAVSGLIDTLGSKAERSKALVKLGLDPSQVKGDATEVLGEIFKKTGGSKDKLGVAFQGEQLKLLTDLGQTYAKTFAETEGDVKTKTKAAVEAYRATLDAAGKSTLSEADMKQQFADEMESNEKKIAQALTKLELTFTKPEIMAAIGKLASALPALADVVVKATSFAVEDPAMAGIAATALLGAKGALKGGIMSLFAGGGGAGAGAGGACGCAETIAGSVGGAGPALARGFGGALGPIGLALGLGVAGMVAGAYRDSVRAENERRGTGKEATRVLDADRQRINEALQQQGIAVDPLAGMSPELARRTTATQAEGDKVEAAIAASRAGGFGLTAEQQARMVAKFGGAGAPDMSMPSPNQTTFQGQAQHPSATPRAAPAAQSLDQLLGSRELRVRVVNPKEIGSDAPHTGALGGGTVVPGWMPR